MTVYCVNYDLRKPGQNYDGLIAALQKLVDSGGGGKPLKSTWMIATNYNAEQIHRVMAPHLDANDGVLIVQASSPAQWSGLDPSWTAWLQSNL